jgi:hypothetical protein
MSPYTRDAMSITSRVLCSIIAVLALVASRGGWLDERGSAHLDAALQRALVSFALARTLNGVISVVQETQIALQPAGVGVTLMPGELLDPLNDLVERFSLVMLASSAAIGIERVLLTMSGWWGVNLLLAIAVAGWLALAWFPRVSVPWRSGAAHVLLTALFLRFAIPLLLVATQAISATFLDAQQQQANAALSTASEQARELSDEASGAAGAQADQSMLDRLSSAVNRLDIDARIKALRENLSHAVEHIIDLIVVFLLETVLVPLALLWLLTRLCGFMLAGAWLRTFAR